MTRVGKVTARPHSLHPLDGNERGPGGNRVLYFSSVQHQRDGVGRVKGGHMGKTWGGEEKRQREEAWLRSRR